jgi:hypothetical protein
MEGISRRPLPANKQMCRAFLRRARRALPPVVLKVVQVQWYDNAKTLFWQNCELIILATQEKTFLVFKPAGILKSPFILTFRHDVISQLPI